MYQNIELIYIHKELYTYAYIHKHTCTHNAYTYFFFKIVEV